MPEEIENTTTEPEKVVPLQPIIDQSVSGLNLNVKPKKPKNKFLPWIIGSVVAVLVLAFAGAYFWYDNQLKPLDDDGTTQTVKIETGSTPGMISKQLQDAKIIRNATAFDIYVRLNRQGNFLQAGSYKLSPSESVSAIVAHLVKGSVDTFDIMFYPGATLVDNTDKAEAKKQDVTTVLKRAGFTSAEISAALAKTYTSKLFAGKPTGADLEGYVLGETYKFDSGATVEQILQRVFDDFYAQIVENGLIAKFTSHNLTLFQAITLASIIQREDGNPDSQSQVAQVFYSRMAEGMTLGSDVTYQYIADKTGVARDPSLDSPYNTRKYTGLPPGPIAVPSLSALKAVANPAKGDYLYFLSGDDDVVRFATTNAEHEVNIVKYCQKKCLIL